MIKSNKYILGAFVLLAAACDYNEDNFEGLDELVNEARKNVVANEYVLTDADYKALAKGQLEYLANTLAFNSQEEAQSALVGFVASKFTALDKGSSVKVYYNLVDQDPVVDAVNGSQQVELSADDYANVWTNGENADYLTPATVSKLPSIIKASTKFVTAASGDVVVVDYKYCLTEPVVESSSDEPSEAKTANWTSIALENTPVGINWQYVNSGSLDLSAYAGQKIRLGFRYTSTDNSAGTIELKNLVVAEKSSYVNPNIFAQQEDGSFKMTDKCDAAGNYVFAAKIGDGYIAFGAIKGDKAYGYCVGDTLTATDGVLAAEDVAKNVMTLETSGDGFTMKNPSGKFLYQTGTYDSFNVADAIPDDAGGVWKISVNTDKTVSILNALKEKTVKYDTGHNSYGCYAESKWAVAEYFNNTLLGSSELPSGFEIVNVNLPSELSYIWSVESQYGFKASAYNGASYASDSWVVSPEIDLSDAKSPYVSIDVAGNKYASGATTSDYFNLYVSADYAEGADFVVEGNKSLRAVPATENLYALYQLDGANWKEYTDAIVLNPADYTAMGSKYANFSSSMLPGDYLPKFLAGKYPYAKNEDVVVVAYNYYDSSSKETTVQAQKYTFSDGEWSMASKVVVSDQYVMSADGWIYDPNVVLELPADKSNEVAKAFYQAATDWVWENVDTKLGFTTKGQGYVTSYANNEYYTGSSAYYNNVDWRVDKAKEQYADGFKDMTNDQILEQLKLNLIEVWGHVLAQTYPDANLVDGTDVMYTINFVVYDGANHNYTIVYKVVGKGEFEYVEGSLEEL